MKTSRRPRIAVAALAATFTVLITGCSQSADPGADTASDPSASQAPDSTGSDKVEANTAYTSLWEEFAEFRQATENGKVTDISSAAAVNAALGWDEDALAAFVDIDEAGACLVSLDGIYLDVADSADPAKITITMGEGIDCPADASDATVVVKPIDGDLDTLRVTKGFGLLPSGTYIADVNITEDTYDAANAVKDAAIVIESSATTDPGAQIDAETVEATLDERSDFTGDVNLSWVEPRSQFDLGYALCVTLPDGSWASWDSEASKVKTTGDLGGCPA